MLSCFSSCFISIIRVYSDTLKMIVWRENVDVSTKVDRSLPGMWRIRSCFMENVPVGLFRKRCAVGKFIASIHSKKSLSGDWAEVGMGNCNWDKCVKIQQHA